MTLKVNAPLFDSLSEELEQDLYAMFNLMEEDINLLTEKAAKENWTPEMLMETIDILFG